MTGLDNPIVELYCTYCKKTTSCEGHETKLLFEDRGINKSMIETNYYCTICSHIVLCKSQVDVLTPSG